MIENDKSASELLPHSSRDDNLDQNEDAKNNRFANFDWTPEWKRALKQELIKIRMISQNEKSVKPVITHDNIENFRSSLRINHLYEKIENNFKLKNMNPLDFELKKNVKE